MKVANIFGREASLAQLTERFGELCADAAQHTDAKIVYELMPPDVNVQTVDAMLEVVGGAAASNGGIAIDTWHMSKLGIAPDELRRIPVEYLSWVELSDGQVENMDDPVDEVVNHRALPGEGEFDIRGYVGRAAITGTAARGGSRCSPPSCARTRWTSSSGGPTTPRSASSSTRGARHDSTVSPQIRNPRQSLKRPLAQPAAPTRASGEVDVSAPQGAERLDPEHLVWIFRQMSRIREFEERVKRTFEEHPGVIRGHTHLADGAEASIVGSIATSGRTTSSSRPTAATATPLPAARTRRR